MLLLSTRLMALILSWFPRILPIFPLFHHRQARKTSPVERAKFTSRGGDSPFQMDQDVLLRVVTRFLGLRDFSSARKYALLAQRSYPAQLEFAKAIAVADVLLASGNPLNNGPDEWFSVLQLNSSSRCGFETQFENLSTLLNPVSNHLPFARDAYQLAFNAWSVLSCPEKKTHLKNGVKNNGDESQLKEKIGACEQEKGTFWTVCPYCYYMYEYEEVYKECGLRCQHCRKAFHGVTVAPEASMMVEGKDEYYFGYGFFPLTSGVDGSSGDKQKRGFGDGECGSGFLDEKKGNDGAFKGGVLNVVEISDDSEDSDCDLMGSNKIGKDDGVRLGEETVDKMSGVKRNMRVGGAGNVIQGRSRTDVKPKVIKNVKLMAKHTKSKMNKGKKVEVIESGEWMQMKGASINAEIGELAGSTEGNSGSGNVNGSDFVICEGDLEFFLGEDDIYIGLKNAG